LQLLGGRHAMGGQQFGAYALLLDTRSINRVLEFDRKPRFNPEDLARLTFK
jgi:hypothetical protein